MQQLEGYHLKEIGRITILHDDNEGIRLFTNMEDNESIYEGLEGSGEDLNEALEDLAFSAEILNR